LSVEEIDANAAAPNTPQIFGGEAPEPTTRTREPWTHERIQSVIQAELADAKNYRDEDLAPARAQAWHYFDGGLFGNEEEGRSQIVSMDLRDTALAIMPSLTRIFLSGEHPVEFKPRGPDDEESAMQRTDYVRLVATEDNPGFRIMWDAMLDALVGRYSVLKWWWDDAVEITRDTFEGLTQEQVILLANEEDVETISYEKEERTAEVPGPDGQPQSVELFTVQVHRKKTISRARYAAIPAEEVLVDRNARTLKDAAILSHVRELPRADILAMGISEAFLEAHEGSDFLFSTDEEYLVRYPERDGREETFNPDLAKTTYGEHLIRFDDTGDGVEWHRVITLGKDYFVVEVEAAPNINFTTLTPLPQPHKLFGYGLHQLLKDIQLIKSAVLRAVLDSLRASIDPRMAAHENFVNFDDLLNQEVGGVVRTTGDPNAVLRELTVPFTGDAGIRVLDYLDTVKETRTGQTKGSQGLNADAMQSTTQAGIAAQLSAAQQRIEMIARIFAETGIKDLYMGLQDLLMRHQDVKRTVRLRGKWVDVDPRTWDAPLDIVVNVGLGTGLPSERLEILKAIALNQEAILQKIGPTEFVDYTKYRATLAKVVEMSGYPDASAFYGNLPPGWTPPAPPSKPDPAELLAQAQMQEIQSKTAIEQGKLAQARMEMLLKTETERMRIESEMQVKILDIEAKYGTQIDEARIQQEIENVRAFTDERIARISAPTAQGG